MSSLSRTVTRFYRGALHRFSLSAALLLLVCLAVGWTPVKATRQPVNFDPSDDDLLVLGNTYYEIGVRKSNGAIAYVTDKATGQPVSDGSRGECLWGAVFYGQSPIEYIGGCQYSATGANRFTYVWSQSENRLKMTYSPDPASAQQATVVVTLTLSAGNWFDAQATVQNAWGKELDELIFPSDLLFAEARIQEVLLPILPGVLLTRDFFSLATPCAPDSPTPDRCYETDYPSWPGVFADFVSLAQDSGGFALYSIAPSGVIVPAHLGIVHDDYTPPGTSARMFLSHTFKAKLANGATWTTPIVRIRVGMSHVEAALAARQDTGIAAFADIGTKLGAQWDALRRAPLYKMDAEHVGLPFNQYKHAVFPTIPYPGILHTVAYGPRGFDEDYPDFLPPSAQYGSTADMAQMFRDAQALGYVTMPYINPTWWDDESPTLTGLPSGVTLADIAALDEQGNARSEFYGAHFGYVMSPHAPFVQERIAQLITQMKQDIPSDLLYEDQVGARATVFDYNPAAPSPAAYSTAWLEHTRQHQGALLTTEMGIDRMAETEVGFHGSIALLQANGETHRWWGDAWRTFPLAPLLLRDKVLLYHATEIKGSTIAKEMLAENLAFGYMLSFDFGALGARPDIRPWLPVVGAFQSRVLASYAGDRMTGYTTLAPDVTRSDFTGATVIANRRTSQSYTYSGHTIAPGGALVLQNDGSLAAGIFWAFNGAALTAGDHYLIVETSGDVITVRQPMGADTAIVLDRPGVWPPSATISATAFGYDGTNLGLRSILAEGQRLRLDYATQVGGRDVAYVEVRASDTPLPLRTYLPYVRM